MKRGMAREDLKGVVVRELKGRKSVEVGEELKRFGIVVWGLIRNMDVLRCGSTYFFKIELNEYRDLKIVVCAVPCVHLLMSIQSVCSLYVPAREHTRKNVR
jgi:hypothetical protein